MKDLNRGIVYLLGNFFVSMAMGGTREYSKSPGNNLGNSNSRTVSRSVLVPVGVKTLSVFLEECKDKAFYKIEENLGEEDNFKIQNSNIWKDPPMKETFEGFEIVLEICDAKEIIDEIRVNRARYESDLLELAKDFQKLNADFANALLTVAMILGNATIVNEILSSKYAFDWKNGSILGFSPLQYAIFLGEVNYLEALLKFEDVDVNFFDYQGRTPLMLAVLEKNPSMVQLLAQRDIELDCTDKKGKTILNYAEKSGNEEIISLLNSFIESVE
jgi:hypothetical protein